MQHTSVPMRLGLWRVTRHRRVRALYDRLADAGVVLAQLDRFERATTPAAGPPTETPTGVDLGVQRAGDSDADVPDRLAAAPLAPADRLVFAWSDGERIGWCVLSDRSVFVPELQRRHRFDGAYLWRLYVRPSARGRGVGTAVITRAVRAAAEGLERKRLVALVAPDNVPSRRAFAGLGFEPTERFTTAGCRGRSVHRRRPLSD